jgi:hypothetical protein
MTAGLSQLSAPVGVGTAPMTETFRARAGVGVADGAAPEAGGRFACLGKENR